MGLVGDCGPRHAHGAVAIAEKPDTMHVPVR